VGVAAFWIPQLANIYGFSHLVDADATNYITYDSRVEDAFMVHRSSGTVVKFPRTADGLYAFKPDQKFLDMVTHQKNMITVASTPDDSDDDSDDGTLPLDPTSGYESSDDSDEDA
jgi:hypothetical protein